MPGAIRYMLVLLACIALLQVEAQPSITASQLIAGQQVFSDIKKTNLYYFIPYGYSLVTDSKGKPDFSLVQMRYTGTKAAGDAGKIKYNNRLQFRIAISKEDQQKITLLKTELKKKYPTAELRQLPVRRFSSVLVFAGTGSTDIAEDSLHLVRAGYEAVDESAAVNNSYWTERIITVGLSNTDAQLVVSAIKNKQSVMSFSYAIYSEFSEKNTVSIDTKGDDKLGKKLKDYFNSQMNQSPDSGRITLIRAEAFNLLIDTATWPTVLQQIDINENLPAKYALFDVYCYDFNNALRDDLFAKKIEIRATGVSGTDITATYTFKVNQPELYSKSIHFSYAIRFDRPFYYRVTEISKDGEATSTAWNEKKEWSELLDITSSPDKFTTKRVDDQ